MLGKELVMGAISQVLQASVMTRLTGAGCSRAETEGGSFYTVSVVEGREAAPVSEMMTLALGALDTKSPQEVREKMRGILTAWELGADLVEMADIKEPGDLA